MRTTTDTLTRIKVNFEQQQKNIIICVLQTIEKKLPNSVQRFFLFNIKKLNELKEKKKFEQKVRADYQYGC